MTKAERRGVSRRLQLCDSRIPVAELLDAIRPSRESLIADLGLQHAQAVELEETSPTNWRPKPFQAFSSDANLHHDGETYVSYALLRRLVGPFSQHLRNTQYITTC